jgi:hypothetical protein
MGAVHSDFPGACGADACCVDHDGRTAMRLSHDAAGAWASSEWDCRSLGRPVYCVPCRVLIQGSALPIQWPMSLPTACGWSTKMIQDQNFRLQPRPGWAPDPLMVGIRSPDGLVVGSCTSHPEILGSIPKREEPGKTGAPCIKVPGSSRVPSLVCGGQPSPHKPRLVVSHSTCPPLSSSPHAHSFVLGTAVINKTQLHGKPAMYSSSPAYL